MNILGVLWLSFSLVSAAAESFEPCGGKPADVFFVLDSSGSINISDFQKELQFTKDVVGMFDTTHGKVRVGVLSFSKTVTPQFELGEYENKRDLLYKIGRVTYEGQGTNTGEALSFLHSKGFSPDRVRPDIPHIAIVLTDGMSQDMKDTLTQAKMVHDAGITVFVIGIGSQVDDMELAAIGSKPTENFVNTIGSFDALANIKEALAIKACAVEPATPAPDLQNTEALVEQELVSFGRCTPRTPLDVVFAVDTAGIGAGNSKYVLDFISNISDHLNMAAGDTSISAVSSGCTAGRLSEDSAYSSDGVKQSFSAFQTPNFDQLLRSMRLRAADGRSGTKHVGVIFMADWLTTKEFEKSQKEIRRARFRGIGTFVFGVGDTFDETQAQSLVTNGGEYYRVFSFPTLGEMGKAFLYSLCLLGTGDNY